MVIFVKGYAINYKEKKISLVDESKNKQRPINTHVELVRVTKYTGSNQPISNFVTSAKSPERSLGTESKFSDKTVIGVLQANSSIQYKHISEMDPLFLACSYFRRRKYQQCVDICTQLLEKNPYDQVMFV